MPSGLCVLPKWGVWPGAQGEIFQSLHEMGPDDLLKYLQSEREAATNRILELTPAQPNAIQYDQLWPQILARSVVKRVDVNKIVARLRTEKKQIGRASCRERV